MNKRSRVTLMIVVACWLSQSVSAVTFVVENNSAAGILSTGSSINGSIDISSVLNDGQYVQPYDIRSVICTFAFVDDGDRRFDY